MNPQNNFEYPYLKRISSELVENSGDENVI